MVFQQPVGKVDDTGKIPDNRGGVDGTEQRGAAGSPSHMKKEEAE
jgi:hypothetical protein